MEEKYEEGLYNLRDGMDQLLKKIGDRIESQDPNDFINYKPNEKVSHPEKEMYFRHLNEMKDLLEEAPGFPDDTKNRWNSLITDFETRWSQFEDPLVCRIIATSGRQKTVSSIEGLTEIIDDLIMIIEEFGDELREEGVPPTYMDQEIYSWIAREVDYLHRTIRRIETREAMFKNMA